MGRFALRYGLDEKLVEQIKKRSLDPTDIELHNNTSDRNRFGEGSYEDWYEKSRYPFALVDEKNNIAALIWFGPSPLPWEAKAQSRRTEDEWDTIAFRCYPKYRGRGIMKDFSNAVLMEHEKLCPGRRLWLTTRFHNKVGIGLYKKLGFEEVGDGSEENMLMIRKHIPMSDIDRCITPL